MKAKWISLLIVICVLLTLTVPCFAAEYTYTLTFLSGKQGSFDGSCVSVQGEDYSVQSSSSKVTVSGLHLNDVVTFQVGGVTMPEDSRYYVRGIRESGKDNSTVGLTAIRVTGDQDFVVAYGIKGNLTQYTVNYQNENGETLADSRTYYGNVGDMPVVAYLYIEGYYPQAYNLSKELSDNSANNVLTFVYTRIPTQQPTTPTTPTTPNNPENPNESQNPNNPTESSTNPSVNPEESVEPNPSTTPIEPSGPQNPTQPSDLVIVTDPDVPLNPGNTTEGGSRTSWLIYAGLCLLALVLILTVVYIIVRKKRKKNG